MTESPPRRRDSPSVLPDELVEEILLRLPPDEPAWLLRASLVCKAWGGALSHPSFRRRLHELHGTPPVLGFLHNWRDGRVPNFVTTTAPAFSLAAPDRRLWRALDCRHGRALFLSKGEEDHLFPWEPITGAKRDKDAQEELLMWEPITGAQQHIPVPATFRTDHAVPSAAVFCAADGCDHRDCHGGPFRVVFVFAVVFAQHDDREDEYITSACVYSSETGAWGELTSHSDLEMDFTFSSSVLVGRSLFYFLSDCARILEYDYAKHGLTVFDPPDSPEYYDERFNLMVAEDGGLGVTQALDPQLKLWSREVSDGTDARWVLSRIIKLENFLPNDAIVDGYLYVSGFAEGANVIFLNTVVGLFMIELQPEERVTKVCDDLGLCNLIPVVSFYTPLPRIKQQHARLSLNPSEEATCKGRGGGEERAVEQEQQPFNEGSRAMEEGDSINAC